MAAFAGLHPSMFHLGLCAFLVVFALFGKWIAVVFDEPVRSFLTRLYNASSTGILPPATERTTTAAD